ncbi:MAG TPA: hypothetical protein EYO61_03385 [Campylobacterales bacterium]|nr:hypothetical protein [Campylobacterales bacterium]
MLTAIAALLVASLVGGVFGSVATYTYVDQSEGKYCDRMTDEVLPDEEIYGEDEDGEDYYDSEPIEEESGEEQ